MPVGVLCILCVYSTFYWVRSSHDSCACAQLRGNSGCILYSPTSLNSLNTIHIDVWLSTCLPFGIWHFTDPRFCFNWLWMGYSSFKVELCKILRLQLLSLSFIISMKFISILIFYFVKQCHVIKFPLLQLHHILVLSHVAIARNSLMTKCIGFPTTFYYTSSSSSLQHISSSVVVKVLWELSFNFST